MTRRDEDWKARRVSARSSRTPSAQLIAVSPDLQTC